MEEQKLGGRIKREWVYRLCWLWGRSDLFQAKNLMILPMGTQSSNVAEDLAIIKLTRDNSAQSVTAVRVVAVNFTF